MPRRPYLDLLSRILENGGCANIPGDVRHLCRAVVGVERDGAEVRIDPPEPRPGQRLRLMATIAGPVAKSVSVGYGDAGQTVTHSKPQYLKKNVGSTKKRSIQP